MTPLELANAIKEMCAKAAENEPELEGPPPPELLRETIADPASALRSTVRVTKRDVAAAIRSLPVADLVGRYKSESLSEQFSMIKHLPIEELRAVAEATKVFMDNYTLNAGERAKMAGDIRAALDALRRVEKEST